MKTFFEHIEMVKGQPHHVRRRIAFGAAGVCTGLIAFVWLASSLATGAFVVQGSSFADAAGQGGVEAVGGGAEASSGLAAAAAALPDADAPARIEIIDAASSTKSAKKAEQTTIPF